MLKKDATWIREEVAKGQEKAREKKRMWPKAKEKNEVKHKVPMYAKGIVKKKEKKREEAQSAY